MAVDEAMVVPGLREYRKMVVADELKPVFERGAYRRMTAVDDSIVVVVSRAHVVARRMIAVDDSKAVVESTAQVNVLVALELLQIVGHRNPEGASSHTDQ